MRATPLGMRLFAKPVVSGITGSAFDPVGSSANWVLSNSNKTATLSSGTGDALAWGTQARTNADARYFEATVNASGTGGSSVVIGLSPIGAANTEYIHQNGAGYIADGRFEVQSTTIFTGSTWTTGDVISICVKAGNAYVAKNGVWQNSANPSAGTGGVSLTAVFAVGNVRPGVSGNFAIAANGSVTLNTGASTFTYSLPTGCAAWG